MPKKKVKNKMERIDLELKFQSNDAGQITGVAATYGGDADGVGDVIAQGAFTASLAQIKADGRKVKMLRDHKLDKPIGLWTRLTDTTNGLKVEGKVNLDNSDGADAYALLKDGTLDALSIGYVVDDFETRAGGGRVLKAITLVEISIVTFPANTRAVVTDVKGIKADPETQGQKAADDEGGTTMPLDTASELDDKLTKALDRIGDLEAKADTVPAVAKDAEPSLETKAFATLVRKGEAKLQPEEFKALQNANDAQGGFLVPEDFRSELIKTVTEVSPMRQVARITGTGRDELTMPKRLTKLQGGWTAELADQTEGEPTYGQIKIPVHELSVFTTISNANLEDSAFNMEAELTSDFGESFGEIESAAFFVGDGVGKPKGILDNTGITAQPSAAAGVVDADDLIDCMYKLKGAYRRNGVWMMNANTLAAVRKLKTTAGDYIWRESLADGQPPTILGRPVLEAPDMPDPVPNAKAVIFGDFARAYRIVSRLDISVLRDPYSLATKSAVKFHARQRVGGDVVQAEAARTIQLA